MQTTIFPRLFLFVNLSADVKAGSYRGISVQIKGGKGSAFYVKSARLQGKQIFDGRDSSLFKNAKGMRIFREPTSGLTVFELTSDSASFDVDSSFTAAAVSGTPVKYPVVALIAELLLALMILASVFKKSRREPTDSPLKAAGDCVNNAGPEVNSNHAKHSGKPGLKRQLQILRRKSCVKGTGSAVMRTGLAILMFCLLVIILAVCGRLFICNELSVSADGSETERIIVEVSDSPDFSHSLGSTSFYNVRETLIKVPERFSSVRISVSDGGAHGNGLRITSSSGSCMIKDNDLELKGSLPCNLDRNGRISIDFSGMNHGDNIALLLLAVLAAGGIMFPALKFLKFSAAMRLMLIIIILSAYITGEICMNVESVNIVFFRSYLQLLPDVLLKNSFLIFFIFILAELTCIRGFDYCGLVLLFAIFYIALDWGVSINFGIRPDLEAVLSHYGSDASTVMIFIRSFFRNSYSSLMAVAMLADWTVMAVFFWQKAAGTLKKYLLLIAVLNCMPFIKVYGNVYSDSSFLLRDDIVDIQGDYAPGRKNIYTKAFPLYDWKPEHEVIDGLNRRKNVVILMVESYGSAYSRYFSGLAGYTPNMDLLAERNASFINYHSTGVETSPATYSLLTGKIFFPEIDRDTRNLHFEYDDALPNIMKSEGYSTAAIYSSEDFAGLEDIYRNSGFDQLYDTFDPAYRGAKRYVFNSVADSLLLSHAADLIHGFDRAGRPHLTFIMTASSHNPFLNPETGRRGFHEVMPYVDREIGKFVRRLEDDGFFANGTLVITGDHHPPLIWFEAGELEKYGEDLNRVPLIIIDRDIGRRTFSNVLGHDSLKSIIEYLNLKKVRKYEYQVIPFWKPEENRSVTVLLPILFQKNYLGGIRVSGPNGELGVYDAKGDESEFAGSFLAPELEKEVAGRVKWLKREE